MKDYSQPVSKQEALERLRNVSPFELICWICHKAKGKRLYGFQLPISQRWSVRIACDECARKLENKVIWYS